MKPSDDVYLLVRNLATDEAEVYSAREAQALDPAQYDAEFVFDSRDEAEGYLSDA